MDNDLLVPKRAIYNIIGCLCKKTELLAEQNVSLSVEDFHLPFYKIIFTAINNMYLTNGELNKITASDIDSYIAVNNQKAYEIFSINSGFDFVNSAIENSNLELFNQNYLSIKKFLMLRQCNSEGFDISEIYNTNTKDELQVSKIESMNIEDILNYFYLKISDIESRWESIGVDCNSNHIKDGLNELVSRLDESPVYGHPFLNKYYNATIRGMIRGNLLIRSCSSGVGKTRFALRDVVSCACGEIYDPDLKEWISNGESYPSTFISTELTLEEVQTCVLAIVSGIPENVIKDGNYNYEDFQRMKKAIEIVSNSPIYIHYIEDFDVVDIEKIIKKDVLRKRVQYVFFDYMQITPKLSRSIQNQFKSNLREDQILLYFSMRLKHLAKTYGVYIGTSTQLNRNSNDRNLRDSTSLSGGSATINKCDHAIQVYDLEEQDLTPIASIMEKYQITPNCVHVLYKNRGGISKINIYTHVDKSTMREKIAFITTKDNKLLPYIKPIDIKVLSDKN